MKVTRDLFLKEPFDKNASPLKRDEIGVVTAVSASGDKRLRYIKVNGKPPLFHYTMFEAANPTVMRKAYLRIRYAPSLLYTSLTHFLPR
ncbi:MAG: hypothetical protein WB566_19660 [Terriglobales bacterium]